MSELIKKKTNNNKTKVFSLNIQKNKIKLIFKESLLKSFF